MAEAINLTNFSSGWIPSDDEINGRSSGLVQMDNVELDVNGALCMTGGCSVKYSGFSNNAHTLYSRIISGARYDYSVDSAGTIFRNTTNIGSGSATKLAGFGTAFNYVLACSGTARKKDTGAATVNLGIGKPTAAPTFSTNSVEQTPEIPDTTEYVAVVGTAAASGSFLRMSVATPGISGQAIIQSYNVTGAPFDWNTFPDGTLETAADTLQINGTNFDPTVGDSIQIDVLLVAGNSSGDVVSDYFTFTPSISDFAFFNSDSIKSYTLFIRRSQFVRIGVGTQNWSTVYGVRITYLNQTGNAYTQIAGAGAFSGYCFNSGLYGIYQYAQMNVNNTGSYLAKSELSILSGSFAFYGSRPVIGYQSPAAIDSQVNEVWIFRRGGVLEQWYRVKVILSSGWGTLTFTDAIPDLTAKILNIRVNLNLASIASSSISEDVLAIVGPAGGRWFYFTTNFMYPSDIGDPDLVDVSLAVRITGSNSELFMWARAVSEGMILVGTSVDIYILTGTFATLPDNTVDIYFRPLGCKFPPVSYDADVYSGQVFYLASDGWRFIDQTGSNKSITAPNTDRLYTANGPATLTFHGYSTVAVPSPGSIRTPIVIARNKIWCFPNNLTRCEVYDTIRQYWHVVDYGVGTPTAACSTQDGQILVFFSDKKLRTFCDQSTKLIDGSGLQTIKLTTTVFDGGNPYNRKDPYTLKLRCFTGSSGNLTAKLSTDSGGSLTISSAIFSTTKPAEIDLDLMTSVPVCKTFQFVLSGTLADFLLDSISLYYDLRPPQLSYLHILSNNYGTTARKRIFGVPYQIDTLGNTVTLTPRIDGLNQTVSTVGCIEKTSFTHKFTASGNDVPTGVDYDYTLHTTSGVFEFFGFEEPRDMEIFPEPHLAYVIPTSNGGTACKKRIRVWPFVIDPRGGTVTFTPRLDGSDVSASTYTFTGKRTVRHQFTSDVFPVDYSGCFSSSTPFEIWKVLDPEIVQILPIAKRFDQIGPEEIFKYGKIKQLELRVLPEGTSIPYAIYFQDSSKFTGNLLVTANIEAAYYIDLPKGISGNIVRIELGPTNADFHRFYMQAQVARSGDQTELTWITFGVTQ